MSPAVLNRISFLLSCLGVFDAGVLTSSHFLQRTLPCGASSGCEAVATDSSSYIGPVPVAALGLGCYIVLLVLAIFRGRGIAFKKLAAAGLIITCAGTVESAYLTSHSIHDLGVVCPWCVGSASIMLLLFINHALMARAAEPTVKWRLADTVTSLLLICVFLPSSIYFAAWRETYDHVRMNLAKLNATPLEVLIPRGSHARGNPHPAITIIEFADLSCGACKRMNSIVRRSLAGGLPAVLVFRHLPLFQLPGHGNSLYAAQLAQSAPNNDAFWKFIDGIYDLQNEPTKDDLQETAKKLFGNSNIAPGAAASVQKDMELARNLNIRQTPSYIILTPSGLRIPATSADFAAKMNEPQVKRWM